MIEMRIQDAAEIQYSPPLSPTPSAQRKHSLVQGLEDRTREKADANQGRDIYIQV